MNEIHFETMFFVFVAGMATFVGLYWYLQGKYQKNPKYSNATVTMTGDFSGWEKLYANKNKYWRRIYAQSWPLQAQATIAKTNSGYITACELRYMLKGPRFNAYLRESSDHSSLADAMITCDKWAQETKIFLQDLIENWNQNDTSIDTNER